MEDAHLTPKTEAEKRLSVLLNGEIEKTNADLSDLMKNSDLIRALCTEKFKSQYTRPSMLSNRLSA